MPENEKCLRMAVRKFGPFESAIRQLWEAFCHETASDFSLETVPMDLPLLHQITLTEHGLKTGGWDIAHLSTDWIQEACEAGAVENLSPYIREKKPDDFPQGWPCSLLQMQTQEGQVMGLPFHDGPECLVYRKDLFGDPTHQAAYRQRFQKVLEPPRTWDEFYDIAVYFQQAGLSLYGAVFAAYPDGHNAVFDFCLQVWSRGGVLTDDQGHVRINTPAAASGVSFYRKMLVQGEAAHPHCSRFDSVLAGEAFARGEAAMMINWFGFAVLSEVQAGSVVKGKMEVAPIPCILSADPVSLNSYWIYAIGSGSHHKKTAYDFIRFAVSQAGDKLLTMEGGIGCRRSTYLDETVNRKIPFFHRLEMLHQDARCLPAISIWPLIAMEIDAVMTRALRTGEAVPKILSEAQIKIDKLYDDKTGL